MAADKFRVGRVSTGFGFPLGAGQHLICRLNTFDRHLLREWLQILAIVVAATCGLLLVQVSYSDLRTLREAGAHGLELWTYFFVTMPSFLAIVLPIALLVSLLFVLTKLHRANELTAMRAAGVGMLRITAPVWLVGVLCCGLAWWLASSIVPWSVQKSDAMHDAVQFRQQSRTLTPDRVGASYAVAYENPVDGRIWMLNRFSRSTGHAYGVSVSELDSQRREKVRLVAAEAYPDPAHGEWVFLRGREIEFNTDTREDLTSVPFAERREKFGEDPELMLLLERREVDLSFFELRRVVNYYAAQHNPEGIRFAVRYYGLIADTLGPLVAIAIAIPFAVTGVRVNAAVGVSKSIGLFCLYYLFTQIAASLAIKQLVDGPGDGGVAAQPGDRRHGGMAAHSAALRPAGVGRVSASHRTTARIPPASSWRRHGASFAARGGCGSTCYRGPELAVRGQQRMPMQDDHLAARLPREALRRRVKSSSSPAKKPVVEAADFPKGGGLHENERAGEPFPDAADEIPIPNDEPPVQRGIVHTERGAASRAAPVPDGRRHVGEQFRGGVRVRIIEDEPVARRRGGPGIAGPRDLIDRLEDHRGAGRSRDLSRPIGGIVVANYNLRLPSTQPKSRRGRAEVLQRSREQLPSL